MNLIEELKNYCDIDNPVGTLMLSGEWGCGKTYLIKNKFIPSEKDTYAFVNVSLFGIDSLDKLRAEVKKKWLEKASEIDKQNGTNVSKFADSYKKIFGIIKDILPEDLQKTGNAFSSIMDLVNFMPISNRMFEKKVVLVFDDLERTNIPCTDLLGCINDYCENQNFNTIIVANEEKIKDSSNNELSYREIKEKIVQRIIPFVPDYEEVVSNCIESVSLSMEYKGFLRKNKELLVKILSGDFNDNEIIEQYKIEQYKLDDNKNTEEDQKEEENLRKLLAQRPHNIRSFKCAIQDFERVYNKLIEMNIQDCSNWLLSFTCLTMTNKAGLILEIPRYGDCFWYLNVEKLYPEVFDTNFIVSGFSKWIIHGEWNDDAISKEVQLFLKKEKATTPLEILRTHKIPEVNDEIIDNGFKELLEEAYKGNLSLDEYILFISNCHYSRSCGLNLPKIDWEKVREGIRQQIKYLVQSDEKDNHFHRVIEDNSKKYFTEDEWSAYQIIKEFRDNDVWVYEKNQRFYIDLISSDLIRAFRDLSNKRYNKFSFEMESATVNAFKNATNANKNHFSGWFVGIWGQYSNSSEIDEQVTMMSLKKLRDDLNFIRQEYKEKNMNIAAMHTQNFIKKLDAIIKPENEDLQTRQVIQ